MATSASQPYIAKLGFQDKDRGTDRHGLACEYLFERLLEMEAAPAINRWRLDSLAENCNELSQKLHATRESLNRNNKQLQKLDSSHFDYEFYQTKYNEAQANESSLSQELEEAIHAHHDFDDTVYGMSEAKKQYKAGLSINQPIKSSSRYVVGFADVLMRVGPIEVLGEVKITKESAETVLQQINFYQAHLNYVTTVYILTDYDCSDLQRLVEGTHIKVYRLGQRFEQWMASRLQPTTDEL
jgi:macrodomain Ter protein organizer (MatP/YcbG family)